MKDQEEALSPGLYVVGTPIGNLEDLGFRALRVLQHANWIAAEDTRETKKLLDHYGISGDLRSFHEHSTMARIEELVDFLKKGGAGAYVSDAGTPGICDPGPELVSACAAAGIPVYPVPGASALLALLSVSGFSDSQFHFHGFFPREKKDREKWAERTLLIGGLTAFFESPHRIHSTLSFLSERFAECEMVVGRELTKRFETLSRGTCAEIAAKLLADPPRGEYVVAIRLPFSEAKSSLEHEKILELVKELALLDTPRKALLRVAMSHGMKKNDAYELVLSVAGS